jgi:hypothetical protein
VAVVRSPLDFVNWVRTYKFFNRYNGVCLAQGPNRNNYFAYAYANGSGIKSKSSITSVIFNAFVGTAIAGTPCEAALENAMSLVESTVLATGSADAARRALNEFAELGSHLQKEIVEGDKLDLLLDNDAIKGIAVMLREGRTNNNVRHIARAIAKTDGLSDAVKMDMINRYFKLIGDLDSLEGGVDIGRHLYGDMGKLLYNSATKSYNTGFIKGMFHQLEFVEDLLHNGSKIEKIEKGIETDKILRRTDIIADGRRFELKNFAHYTGDNVKAVKEGIEKDLVNVIANSADEKQIIEGLGKIHFVFRGNSNGAGDMIEAMSEVGSKIIDKDEFPIAYKYFEDQISAAKSAIENNATQIMPEIGDLIVFQGKNVPF